jgi:hypothetical protein
MSYRPVPRPTHPAIKWVMGALSPGVKQLGHEADHSPPTNAEVKNTWIYISILLCPQSIMPNELSTGATLPSSHPCIYEAIFLAYSNISTIIADEEN